METTERILREFTTIAVVGASRDPDKAAHGIPRALKAAGFHVIPVNPHVPELLGERSYPNLAAIDVPIEVVLVFRPSAEAAELTRQAVAAHAKAVWLQVGITSKEARKIAEDAGLLYVEDRCIGVERAVLRVVKGPTAPAT